jgi:hypothetical protein
MKMFKIRRVVLLASCTAQLVNGLLGAPASAESPSLSSAEYTSLFSLDDGIAAYSPNEKRVEILRRNGGALENKEGFRVSGQVGALAQTPLGIAVATGQGRGDLTAPIRITLYDATGANPRTVFEQAGERSQLSFLKWVDGKLWATYFESKYITKTGFFLPSTTFPWVFKEVKSVRLGDAVDVLGDSVIIGRPYGDVQGQDGDISLLKGEEQLELPSYRGVRSVLAFNGPSSQEIVIGDGWHQNYGQNAQARLSWLKKDSESGRYALQLIDHDTTQYNFSKLKTVELGGSTFIAALGNKQLAVYGPRPTWRKSILYTRTEEENYFDFVPLDSDSNGAWFLVLNKGLHLVRFDKANMTKTATSLQ